VGVSGGSRRAEECGPDLLLRYEASRRRNDRAAAAATRTHDRARRRRLGSQGRLAPASGRDRPAPRSRGRDLRPLKPDRLALHPRGSLEACAATGNRCSGLVRQPDSRGDGTTVRRPGRGRPPTPCVSGLSGPAAPLGARAGAPPQQLTRSSYVCGGRTHRRDPAGLRRPCDSALTRGGPRGKNAQPEAKTTMTSQV